MAGQRYTFIHITIFVCAGVLTAALVLSCSEQGSWDLFLRSQLGQEEFVVTFQQGVEGYSGTKDTHILEWAGLSDNNAGAHDILAVTNYFGGPDHERAILIEFDLSSIPSTAEIEEAVLSLYFIDTVNGNTVSKTVYAYRLNGAWDEGTGSTLDGDNVVPPASGVTWDTQPSYDPITPPVSATIGTVYGVWYPFEITSAVQGWVRNGSSNHGILIKQSSPNPVDGLKLFASSEYATLDWRPKLTVSYYD